MDKYVRVKKIGEGSFGKALLVRSKANGKQLVVKEINMTKMQRKEREEARKEVAVLAQLNHPNIVCYKESFEEIGNLYIVMDYCDAGDLYGKINQQRGILFGEDQVLDWFVQTCLAIKHIHDRKILHRDIKSQNIFLTRHGIVKLGDFGIAKVLNSTVELARTCIGTPYYLSPEICENKPYNNKSDVWSLGCVLYELTTLKHAFEAGNMKNLVLKIIRGSYPPPPPRYSYDLRSLIAQLFKRSPRDRPSINSVLKKPVLQTRIKKFLSENEMQDEFSHTVMHGVKIKKQIPPGGARPLPPKPQPASRAPTPSQPQKYNPVSVYAPSVARKSANKENRKSSEVRKSGGANVKRPSPSPAPAGNHLADLNKRRQELLERERKRREEARKREQQAQQQLYAKRHQNLVEKQKAARINRAREEGWKGLMESLSSEDSDKKSTSKSVCSVKSNDSKKSYAPKKKISPSPRRDDAPKIDVKPATPKPAVKDRGNYDDYHAYLDKLQQDRDPRHNPPALGVAGALGGAAYGGAAQAAKQGMVAGAKGAEAADRARVLGEYMQRKQQAAVNKARAHGDLYGGAGAAVSPRMPKAKTPTPTPSAGRPASARDSRSAAPSSRPSSAADKNEQDYLAKLRQIRLQNFNDRRNNKDKGAGNMDKYKPPIDPRNDADLRRRKIEALKAQADERAKKLRDELEKKRKDAYDSEQKRLKDQMDNLMKHMYDGKKPVGRPAAPVPMTEAMKAIGAIKDEPKPVSQMEKCSIGMTAAMEAIGAGPATDQEDPKVQVQKKKDSILKRLNKKPPVSDKPDRPKWGDPVKPVVPERPKWGDGSAADLLKGRSLEETGSHMDATSARDVVVRHSEPSKDAAETSEPADSSVPVSARKQWGGRANTVINVLEHADLADGSGTAVSQSTDSNTSQPTSSVSVQSTPAEDPKGTAPAIGTTITLAKGAGKGTVVIKKADPISSSEQISTPPSEPSGEQQSSSPTLKVNSSDRPRSRSSSPPANQDRKSALFERVDLDEEEGSKEGQGLVVEDMDDVQKPDSPGVVEAGSKPALMKKPSLDKDSSSDKVAESNVAAAVSSKDTTKKMNMSMKDAGLLVGLTTGHFDTDIKLLRTCSEPDLSKLFRTNLMDNPFFDDDVPAMNLSSVDAILEASDDEDEEDMAELALKLAESLAAEEDDARSEGEEGEVAEEEDENEEEGEKVTEYEPDFGELDDEEDEDNDEDGKEDEDDLGEDEDNQDTDEDDLQTLRESMMSLLQNDDLEEGEEPLDTTAKRKVKRSAKKGKKIKKKKTKEATEPRLLSREWSDNSVADFQSMRETMKTLLIPEPSKDKKTTLKPIKEQGAGDATSSSTSTKDSTQQDVRESWQSDGEEDDDYFEEDMFSRAEENRAKLEQELGCDSFIKAYKTVQAIHEDEDENMEEGIQLVSSILGHDKIHLYPSILQLVMADGVFTEDND